MSSIKNTANRSKKNRNSMGLQLSKKKLKTSKLNISQTDHKVLEQDSEDEDKYQLPDISEPAT